MTRRAGWLIPAGLVAAAFSLVGACGSPVAPGADGYPWDVRGNYALTYDDQLTLRLNLGGAIREVTVDGYGQVVDFGLHNGQPLTLDLAQFCARPEVQCPSEAFWSKVAIDQQQVEKDHTLHVINVIDDTVHQLEPGERAAVVGGLVDRTKDHTFLIGLGAKAGGNQNCGALALSLAGGRFSRVGESIEQVTVYRDGTGAPCEPDAGTSTSDAGDLDGGNPDGGSNSCEPVEVRKIVASPTAPIEGIKEGKVVLGWLGGCAFGPVLVGASLTMETGFTGVRTGNFDPPPFTPVPAELPDGGMDGGADPDGGP